MPPTRALTVIVDTREQEPYGFTRAGLTVIRRALGAGDYSVEGYESSLAVERKSLADFVGTVITARTRFFKELDKLQRFTRACVVVEASIADVFAHRYRSQAAPKAIFGAAMQITVDLNIPVFFCGDRGQAREFVEAYLVRAVDAVDAARDAVAITAKIEAAAPGIATGNA